MEDMNRLALEITYSDVGVNSVLVQTQPAQKAGGTEPLPALKLRAAYSIQA